MDPVVKAPPGWDRVVEAAERHAPEVERRLLAWAESQQHRLSVDQIVRAISDGQAAEIVAAMIFAEQLAEALAPLETMAVQSSRTAAGIIWDQMGPSMPGQLGPAEGAWFTQGTMGAFQVDFAAVDETAARWAAEHAARLIVEIGDETRRAVRTLIARAPVEGVTVYQQARLLRDMIGLTERQGTAVFNRYQSLVRQWQAGNLSWRQVERLTDRYMRRQLRYRAEMIARTESLNAARASQYEGWRQAARAGMFDPDTAYIGWSAVPSACETCLELERTGRWPLEHPPDFDVRASELRSLAPHPNCRCSPVLITGQTA